MHNSNPTMLSPLKILVIHGPNLNLLGIREPNLYGTCTLKAIDQMLFEYGTSKHVELTSFQSNHEGAIIDQIQRAKTEHISGILINPAGFTHTSIAIRDAILAVSIPTVEVHLSNVFQREDFRHTSYLSSVCIGMITGFGAQSYLLGLKALIDALSHHNQIF